MTTPRSIKLHKHVLTAVNGASHEVVASEVEDTINELLKRSLVRDRTLRLEAKVLLVGLIVDAEGGELLTLKAHTLSHLSVLHTTKVYNRNLPVVLATNLGHQLRHLGGGGFIRRVHEGPPKGKSAVDVVLEVVLRDLGVRGELVLPGPSRELGRCAH